MDNVDCAHGNELLEDCTTNGWGVHNCRHDADIGVICLGGILNNGRIQQTGSWVMCHVWIINPPSTMLYFTCTIHHR